MDELNAALLINLLGFSVGVALYVLLGVMVVRHGALSKPAGRLLLTTALLGFLWNVGQLYALVQTDFSSLVLPPIFVAIAFSALGFLPSVVVHSAQADEKGSHWLTLAAYILSTFAAVLHFRAVFVGGSVPSDLALQTQTVGSL